MQTYQLTGFFSRNVSLRFAKKRFDEKSPAHANSAVNAPNRQLDAGLFECFAPSEHVLVDAINQSAVQIEKKGWR